MSYCHMYMVMRICYEKRVFLLDKFVIVTGKNAFSLVEVVPLNWSILNFHGNPVTVV